MKRKFDGVWIPRDIWINHNLTPTDRCLLAEINSLDSSERGCFASNKYFHSFFSVSESTIKRSINKLAQLELIEISYKRTNKGVERKIHTTFGQVKMTRADRSNRPVRTGQNDLHNSIDNNSKDLLFPKKGNFLEVFPTIDAFYETVKKKLSRGNMSADLKSADFNAYYIRAENWSEDNPEVKRSASGWATSVLSWIEKDIIKGELVKKKSAKSMVANQYDALLSKVE